MRKKDSIIIHCSYTPPAMDIGAKEIDAWHRDQGWDRIGYHYVIRRDGTVEDGRPVEQIGAHVKGYNEHSIAICIIGGMQILNDEPNEKRPDCNFTRMQWTSLEAHVTWLHREHDNLRVFGHRDFNPLKACPCFDARAWWYV